MANKLEMTKKDLASLTGYTYRRLHDIDKELPDNAKLFILSGSDLQKCDARIFVQHWVDYCVDKYRGADAVDLDSIRATHEKIKTEKTRLEVDRLSGQLVSVQEVKRLWGDVARTVATNFLHLPSKVAPSLLMMDDAEQIAAIIDGEVRRILEDIANTPLPDSVVAAGDGDDE